MLGADNMANGNEQILDDIENEEAAQINQEEYELWNSLYQAERKAYQIQLANEFNDYIYNNYAVGNGTMLINILENGEALESFLDLKGLPPDTEIDI